jgi:hypothetical protein
VTEQKRDRQEGGGVTRLQRVELRAPVVVEDELVVQYVHEKDRFEVRSAVGGAWKLHVVGEAVHVHAGGEDGGEAKSLAIEKRSGGGREVDEVEMWDKMVGVKFGPSFRWLRQVRPEGAERRAALCWLRAPEKWTGSVFALPLELIDTVFQSVNFLNLSTLSPDAQFLSPFAMEEIVASAERRFEHHTMEDLVTETRFVSGTERTVRLDAELFVDGRAMLEMRGLTLAGASEEAFLGQAASAPQTQMRELMYEVVWAKERGETAEGAALTVVVVVASEESVATKMAAALRVGARPVEVVMVKEEDGGVAASGVTEAAKAGSAVVNVTGVGR